MIGLTLFVGAMAFNLHLNSMNNEKFTDFTLKNIETLAAPPGEEDPGPIICEATVDCDLVAGDGSVTCYGYDPDHSCISYPALGKVKCDGNEHYCQIIPSG